MSVIPDLTPTVIDSETGEVIRQGLEGPEIDRLRARHNEGLRALWEKKTEKLAAQKSKDEKA